MSGRTRVEETYLMIPITALAFFILVYMWSLKLRLSSTWTPIPFSRVEASNLTWFADPSSEFVAILKVGGVSSSLYPNNSTLHLSGWNLRSQSYDHLHTQSRSCNCSLSLDVSVLASRFVSSANITSVELFWMESWRSLMYKTNKVGRRTEPCGIPLVTCVHLDESSPTLTICLLPIRKLFIHPSSCPSMPYASLWKKHGIKGLA